MLDRNLGEEEEMVRRWEWDRDCDSSERDLNDFISLSELREGGRKSRGKEGGRVEEGMRISRILLLTSTTTTATDTGDSISMAFSGALVRIISFKLVQ